MKIWHQSLTDISKLPAYSKTLEEHFRIVGRSGTEFVLHGLKEGTYGDKFPLEILAYSYVSYLNIGQVLENVLQAEKEGYDAFAICSCTETGLPIARSLVDIPVVGLLESGVYTACMLAKKFSLVVPAYREIFAMGNKIRQEYGVSERLAGINYLETKVQEKVLDDALENPRAILEKFEEAAKPGIEAGSEMILPAEGVLNELIFKNKIREIGGVPIMDMVGALVKVTEGLVDLKKNCGVSTSRRMSYQKPPKEIVKQIRRFYGLKDI